MVESGGQSVKVRDSDGDDPVTELALPAVPLGDEAERNGLNRRGPAKSGAARRLARPLHAPLRAELSAGILVGVEGVGAPSADFGDGVACLSNWNICPWEAGLPLILDSLPLSRTSDGLGLPSRSLRFRQQALAPGYEDKAALSAATEMRILLPAAPR